ncbi:hypothetical protein PR202_ga22590 [Eleusine coracana subsp. coracana]|uniref:Uncharacterized protein n=1 Tax=Eleusine coracana subsp. coracana TaxID=191504 RepID=A0AAV5D3Q3_ELECO|nr:hypothetical protein PR202_ga22590 [Eleusine coracana subsp. coracana]
MRRIESELRMIHCFLAQMETRYDNKQVLQSWIGEARKLGCLVEQTMDEYVVRILHKKGVGKKLLDVPAFALASRRLVAQLKEIEVELEHLSKMKKRWVQVDSQISLPVFSTQSHVSNNELTYGERREELIMLLDKGGQDLSVIAICGQRGSGKTHLVKDVYQSVRKDFDCTAWISLSQCPSTDDAVLKRTIQELQMDDSFTESSTVEDYIQSLMTGLKKKKFLFVFDDVQVPDAVRKARHTSFNNKMSSRIIIITRMRGVASGSECSVEAEFDTPSSSSEPPKLSDIQDLECMELTCLRFDEAFNLFCAKAFGSNNCPEQLRETSKRIITLCDQLPQAIVSIGASLSLKQPTQSVWHEMIEQICRIRDSKSSLNDIHKILYVSYNNLPMHLKNCLLYCSIFPAGHLLLPERLVRLWIAEGFIEKQVSSQLEEIAYNYVQELIRWGFLQIIDSDEFGQVASCRMPIVVHELAVSISQKEEFGASCHGVKLEEMDTNVRCLFISKYHEDIGSSIDFPHLRTLIAGEDAASCLPSIPASLPSKHKYITVLELQGSQIKELPYNIGYHLFNLRYLGLRNTEIRELPYSMHRLYSLQTLDLKWSGIQELPSWIGNLTTLRHLFADNLIDKSQTEFLFFRSLRARKGVKHLKELQTLETVQTSTFFENNVNHLTQLSSLCVGNVEGRSCKTLFASLSKISSLSSLTVSACHSKEELRFQTLTSDHLKRLVVRGRLFNKTFECPIFMSKSLQSLELSWCNLWEDSLLELSKNLCKLVSLSLHRVSGISQLVFQKNSFAKLRRLVLTKIDAVTDLKILDGSLESLEVLHVESLDSIRELQNIQDLSKILCVRDLYFPKLISLHRGTDDIDGAVAQHL